VTGSRRGRRRSASAFLALIAEQARLEYLRLLPAFQRFEEDLLQALCELRFII
jgi:hypothetical protein